MNLNNLLQKSEFFEQHRDERVGPMLNHRCSVILDLKKPLLVKLVIWLPMVNNPHAPPQALLTPPYPGDGYRDKQEGAYFG